MTRKVACKAKPKTICERCKTDGDTVSFRILSYQPTNLSCGFSALGRRGWDDKRRKMQIDERPATRLVRIASSWRDDSSHTLKPRENPKRRSRAFYGEAMAAKDPWTTTWISILTTTTPLLGACTVYMCVVLNWSPCPANHPA